MSVEYDVIIVWCIFLLNLNCENLYEDVELLWWCCWWLLWTCRISWFACLMSCLRIAGASSVLLSVDRVLDRLWSKICFFYVVEILPMCWDLDIIFSVDVFMSWWHGYLRYMLYFCCDVLLLKFLCMSMVNYWRRGVYFLNICYIHVIYRFNRSRALHLVFILKQHRLNKLAGLQNNCRSFSWST